MTDFSPDLLAKLEQIVESSNSGAPGLGGSENNDWPYADPGDWSNEQSFDTSIPYNADGTVNVKALEEELHKIMYYSANGDQMDYNSQLDIAAMVMNIAGVWGKLSSADQSAISQQLNTPINGVPFLQKVAPDIIQTLIHGYFYKNCSSDPNIGQDTINFAQNLINTLQQLSGRSGIVDPLLSAAENYGNVGNLTAWMKSTIDPTTGKRDLTFDDFSFMQAIQWETDFSMSSDTNGFFALQRHNEIQSIFDQYGDKHNPMYIYMLLLSILTSENGDIQTQISGRGALLGTITNAFGNAVQSLTSSWQGMNFTEATAQAFFQKIYDLQTLAQDKRFSSIAPQINKIFNDFFSTTDGVKIPDPKNPGKQITIGQFYQNIRNNIPGYSWNGEASGGLLIKGLVQELNDLAPTSDLMPPPPASPSYTQISGDLGQLSTTITNSSQVQQQVAQDLEGLNEKDLAMLTAAFNAIVDPEKVFTQNMASAGN